MTQKTVDFLTVKDVANLTGYHRSKAGAIIRSLNLELERQGYITFKGRVLTSYFSKRVGESGREEDSS